MISRNKINPTNSITYTFGEFHLETENLLLLRNSEVVPLAPKACEVLLALVQANGKLLTRQEILDAVWADSFVEEANLTHHISTLRKALGEDGSGRKFIETLPRKGYRFVADVKNAANGTGSEIIINERTSLQFAEETNFESSGEKAEFNVAPISPNKQRRLIWTLTATSLILLLGASVFFGYRSFYAPKGDQLSAPTEIKIKRLTPDADAISPSVSPDGLSVVFSRDEKGQEILWRKSLVTGEMTQLLPASSVSSGRIIYTRFSPDGKWIYYFYIDTNGTAVFRIPSGGGTPQKILADVWTDFAISPDGKQLAYCFDFRQIFVVDIETGERRIVAERDSVKSAFKGNDLDSVAWSPDGSKLAVGGSVFDGGRNIQQILEIDVKSGAEKVMATDSEHNFQQIEWLADGGGLIVTLAGRIAYVDIQTGKIENITSEEDVFGYLRLSANSKTLVATRKIGHYNIWTAPADNLDKKRQITIGAAARQRNASYLGNGRIVYVSDESGTSDIWTINEDGSDPRRLTINAASNVRPHPTLNNRYIVFLSSRSGTLQIWRMESDGRNPVQLSKGQESWDFALGPENYVYYINPPTQEKKYPIFKVPVTGGDPVEVEQSEYPVIPIFSPDGKWFVRWGDQSGAGVPIVSLIETASNKPVRSYKNPMTLICWSLDSKFIYFTSPEGQEFWRQPLEGEAQKLYDFRPMKAAGFNFSADGKKIVFSLGTSTSEVVSIENFLAVRAK